MAGSFLSGSHSKIVARTFSRGASGVPYNLPRLPRTIADVQHFDAHWTLENPVDHTIDLRFVAIEQMP